MLHGAEFTGMDLFVDDCQWKMLYFLIEKWRLEVGLCCWFTVLQRNIIYIIIIIQYNSPDLFNMDGPGRYIGYSQTLSRGFPWLALSNFDQRFSGEKPWDFSLDENSPYFAPVAAWDRTRDLPLSWEFRIVSPILPVQPLVRVRQV